MNFNVFCYSIILKIIFVNLLDNTNMSNALGGLVTPFKERGRVVLCFASCRQKVQRTRPKNYFPRIRIDLQQNSSINRKGDSGLSSHPASNLHGNPRKLDSTINLAETDGLRRIRSSIHRQAIHSIKLGLQD